MTLKYHVSPSIMTENFVVRLWEAGSDGVGAHIFETTLVEKNGSGVPTVGAGHQVPETLTINGLDKVVHIVRMYGATSGALLHEYNAEPKVDTLTVFAPIRFKIGDGQSFTPAAGSNTCTIAALTGFTTDDFTIMRNNYGLLFPGNHFSFAVDTFTLLGGDSFNASEEFTIQIKPQVISTVVNDSVVGKWVGGFVDIASNTNFSSTHLRKLIRFAGTCTYTFPIGATIPIGYGFVFQHFGSFSGGGGVGTINFSNAPLKWGNTTKTSIDLPSYSEGCFVFDGTNWNVVYISDSKWINGGVITPGATIAVGELNVGDIPGGDHEWTITHGMNITGDYTVMVSIKANSRTLAARNNTIGYCWYHHQTDKPNKFYINTQEIYSEVQNVSLAWVIIKL